MKISDFPSSRARENHRKMPYFAAQSKKRSFYENRLTEYSNKHPAVCKLTDSNLETGCKEFEIEKGRLSFWLTAPYSEKRRLKASKYAKRNGFKSQAE